MIKTILTKAVVGTAAAGALILPGAAAVAPPMNLMACQYQDTIATNTQQTLSDYAVRKGSITSTVTVTSIDGSAPNGTVTVTLTGPGGTHLSKSKNLSGSDTTVSFRFGGFGQKKEGVYTFTASFKGTCKYDESDDTDQAVVSR